jgi:hypothetical protein
VFNRQAYDIAQKRIERDDTVDVGDTVLLIISVGLVLSKVVTHS